MRRLACLAAALLVGCATSHNGARIDDASCHALVQRTDGGCAVFFGEQRRISVPMKDGAGGKITESGDGATQLACGEWMELGCGARLVCDCDQARAAPAGSADSR